HRDLAAGVARAAARVDQRGLRRQDPDQGGRVPDPARGVRQAGAGHLGRRVLGIDLPRARDLGPILMAWAVSLLLLIFESDIGTSAVFMGLFVAMLYIATSRTSWLLIGFLMFVVGAITASKLVCHVGERFDIWLHPFTQANVEGNSYQLVQGLYGMGSG